MNFGHTPRLGTNGCELAMSPDFTIINATLILPDQLLSHAGLHVCTGRIACCGPMQSLPSWDGETVDAEGQFLAPGFVDMHVHGGDGADFMDGDAVSFATVIATLIHLEFVPSGIIAIDIETNGHSIMPA